MGKMKKMKKCFLRGKTNRGHKEIIEGNGEGKNEKKGEGGTRGGTLGEKWEKREKCEKKGVKSTGTTKK